MRQLMVTRGQGIHAEAELVVIDVENGRAILALDDGEILSFDLEELRAALAIAEGAEQAETRAA